MTRDVQIQIISTGSQQKEENEEADPASFSGQFMEEDGVCYVKCEEEMEGLSAPLHTSMEITGDRLALSRIGELTTCMIFSKGACTSCEYQSPYGTILMNLDTKEWELTKKEDLLMIDIRYDIVMEEGKIPDCGIKIIISSVK